MNVRQTSRLRLRLMALQDVENIHALIYSDPEVALPFVRHLVTLDALRAPNALLTRIARVADEPGLLVVERSGDRAILGVAGFVEIRPDDVARRFAPPDVPDVPGADPSRREAEFAIALGRSYWNRGYATEAATALIEIGFGTLHLDRIVASVAAGNERGLKLLRGLGFRIVPNRVTDFRAEGAQPGSIGLLDAPARS